MDKAEWFFFITIVGGIIFSLFILIGAVYVRGQENEFLIGQAVEWNGNDCSIVDAVGEAVVLIYQKPDSSEYVRFMIPREEAFERLELQGITYDD